MSQKFTDIYSTAGLLYDSRFLLKSFAEYSATKAQEYTRIVSVLQDISNLDDEEEIDIDGYLLSNDVNPNAWVSTSGGYSKIGDIARTLRDVTVDPLAITGSVPAVAGGIAVEQDLMGVVDDMLDQCLNATAMSECIKVAISDAGVSDRLSQFNANLGQAFTSAVTASSAQVSYYSRLLGSKLDAPSIFNSIAQDMGAKELAEANDDSKTVDEFNIADYTGSSPMGPLNFDNAANAASTVVQVGAKIVTGIAKTLFGFLSSGVKKAVDYVETVVVDPVDYAVVNKQSETRTFGPLNINQPTTYRAFESNIVLLDSDDVFSDIFNPSTESIQKAVSKFNSDELHIYQTLFGTLVIKGKVKDLSITRTQYDNGNLYKVVTEGASGFSLNDPTLTDGLKYNFYPSVWNIDALKDIVGTSSFHGSASYVRSVLSRLSGDGAVYDVWNLPETKVLNSMVNGMLLLNDFVKANVLWRGNGSGGFSYDFVGTGSTVTNRDFVIATGAVDPLTGQEESPVSDRGEFKIGSIVNFFVTATLMSYLEREVLPMDYGFFPYSTDAANLPVQAFRIKTDAENYEAFNNFGTTVVITAAVVFAALYIGVKVKKIAKAKAWKRESILASTQAKMWNGESLTPKEKRAYQRAVKKGGVQSLFNKSLPSVDTPDASGDILALIKG